MKYPTVKYRVIQMIPTSMFRDEVTGCQKLRFKQKRRGVFHGNVTLTEREILDALKSKASVNPKFRTPDIEVTDGNRAGQSVYLSLNHGSWGGFDRRHYFEIRREK